MIIQKAAAAVERRWRAEPENIVKVMDRQQINGRDVFIVDAHHEVLAAWAHVRERLGFPPHLLSFDSHTDCHRAFMRHLRCPYDDPALVLKGNPLVQKVRFADPVSISDAITLLAHDEHIDCARRADIIDRVFISLGAGLGGVELPGTMVFDDLCLPACSKKPHDEFVLARSWEVLPERKWRRLRKRAGHEQRIN